MPIIRETDRPGNSIQKVGNDKAGTLILCKSAGFRVTLGDRDLNPKFLIQSQMFCRLNYPRSTMISYHGAPHRASFARVVDSQTRRCGTWR